MARAVLRLLVAGMLVATVLGAVYLLVGAPSLAPVTTAAAPQAIARGFIGVASFGHWRLICAPEPAPSPGNFPNTPTASNQCRINQEVAAKDPPHPVILAANLQRLRSRETPHAHVAPAADRARR